MKPLLCSDKKKKKRLADVKNMSFEELEKYNTKCGKCGDWIFKEQDFANKTYNAVSNKWAEEFTKKTIKGS